MDGILASIFLGFWSILGGKLGGKPEPRSTQKGIEKRCKKEKQRDCQKSRNKNPGRRRTPRVLGPGEVSPKESGEPLPPGRRRSPATLFHTFPFQSLPFLFLSLPLPSLPLSSFVLACLGLSWSQLGPNLTPKIHQNQLKIDAKMPSHLDSIFGSIFHRFLPPTSIP